MANTPTAIHGLLKPAWKDGRWDVPTNENWDDVDALLPPKGGTTDQVLAKASDTDNDYKWATGGGGGGGGGGLTWSVVTADTTAEESNGYIVDTSVAGKTLTLPLVPEAGMTVGYKDLDGSFGTNPLTVDGNGANIQGVSEDMVVDSANAGGTLVYANATEGWVLTSATPMTTICSKPLLHVQDQKTTGTAGGTSVTGDNDRDLNTILTNEISGASLSANEVTLPAGTYYIEGFTSGLVYASATMRSYVRKSDDTNLLVGEAIKNGNASTVMDSSSFSGKITLAVTTTIKAVTYQSSGVAQGLGDPLSQTPYEVYSDLRIWRLDMDKVYPNLTDPSVALSKPLLHAQRRELGSVNGGTSTAGWNDRPLTALLINEISGASLSSNEITLPAGTYYASGTARCRDDLAANFSIALTETDNTVILEGVGNDVTPDSDAMPIVEGQFTLSASTTIKLRTYHNTAYTLLGFGYGNTGTDWNIFEDLRIWQVDAVTQTPIVRQPINTPITNAYTTGGIYGGELVYVDADSIDVNPVSCYSDDLTTALFIDATTRVDIVGATINTIYHMFLIKDTSNDFDVLYDTDINGAGLPGTVSKKRWLGFVTTDSSGNITTFVQNADEYRFTTTTGIAIGSGTGAQFHDISSFVPTTRVIKALVSVPVNSGHSQIKQHDGGASAGNNFNMEMGTGTTTDFTKEVIPSSGYVTIYTANSVSRYLHGVTLKR